MDNQYIINPLSLHAILNFSFFFVTFRFGKISFRFVSIRFVSISFRTLQVPRVKSSLQTFYGLSSQSDWPLRNIQISNDNGFYFTFYIDVLFPLSLPRLLPDYIWGVTLWVSYMKQELLTIREHPSSPRVFGEVRIAYLFSFGIVLLCVFTFWVPCCGFRHDFRNNNKKKNNKKTRFCSFLPQVVCSGVHVLFTLFVCGRIVVSITCCVVFLRLVLPISLDCPFLIAPYVFSNVYSAHYGRINLQCGVKHVPWNKQNTDMHMIWCTISKSIFFYVW